MKISNKNVEKGTYLTLLMAMMLISLFAIWQMETMEDMGTIMNGIAGSMYSLFSGCLRMVYTFNRGHKRWSGNQLVGRLIEAITYMVAAFGFAFVSSFLFDLLGFGSGLAIVSFLLNGLFVHETFAFLKKTHSTLKDMSLTIFQALLKRYADGQNQRQEGDTS